MGRPRRALTADDLADVASSCTGSPASTPGARLSAAELVQVADERVARDQVAGERVGREAVAAATELGRQAIRGRGAPGWLWSWRRDGAAARGPGHRRRSAGSGVGRSVLGG